jgi:hypothetical protein
MGLVYLEARVEFKNIDFWTEVDFAFHCIFGLTWSGDCPLFPDNQSHRPYQSLRPKGSNSSLGSQVAAGVNGDMRAHLRASLYHNVMLLIIAPLQYIRFSIGYSFSLYINNAE